ncbi:UNVERIFIED_CONTAM: hypothetical protein K2H54_054683 [Gekko kuhli]
MDLTQFRQWIAEQQVQLLRDMTRQQQQAQATMMRDLHQAILTVGQAPASGRGGTPSAKGLWPSLTKMDPEDDVEASLEVFELAAEATKWPPEQWAFILGPYLTVEAQAAMKALEKDAPGILEAIKRFHRERGLEGAEVVAAAAIEEAASEAEQDLEDPGEGPLAPAPEEDIAKTPCWGKDPISVQEQDKELAKL